MPFAFDGCRLVLRNVSSIPQLKRSRREPGEEKVKGCCLMVLAHGGWAGTDRHKELWCKASLLGGTILKEELWT